MVFNAIYIEFIRFFEFSVILLNDLLIFSGLSFENFIFIFALVVLALDGADVGTIKYVIDSKYFLHTLKQAC